jgi:hypothetical protein
MHLKVPCPSGTTSLRRAKQGLGLREREFLQFGEDRQDKSAANQSQTGVGSQSDKRQERKEVILMKYAKPEISEASAPIVAIKGTMKASSLPLEQGTGSYPFTPQAYEADE